jgi:transposase
LLDDRHALLAAPPEKTTRQQLYSLAQRRVLFVEPIRLSAQVQEVLRQDPLSGHVFVFFNRQRNRVKLLVWERDGFWLLYKRLEAGTFAALERDEIDARELYILLEGIEVVRERRRYTRLPMNV